MNEKMWKDADGEWHVSQWKNGRYHYSLPDGHTYTLRSKIQEIGDHIIKYCPCSKEKKQ